MGAKLRFLVFRQLALKANHSATEALRLFDRNANYASLHDAKRTGSAQRYINYTAFDERPAIIDSAAD